MSTHLTSLTAPHRIRRTITAAWARRVRASEEALTTSATSARAGLVSRAFLKSKAAFELPRSRTEPRTRFSLVKIRLDRKSTRLNSSHVRISYAVFCLKKQNRPGTHRHNQHPS